MAHIPSLDNSPLNLTSIREHSRKELINILKNIRGKKCLAIDPKLGSFLSLIVQTSVLKELGVELRHLSADPIHTDCPKIIYLVPSDINLIIFICLNIHYDIANGQQKDYFVYFVPRTTVACEKILEEEKVHHLITIGEYPLYVFPMDEDVLSFGLDLTYKECNVDGDMSSLWHIAKAIHKLEFSFGVIPDIKAKGKASVRVSEILSRLQDEEPVESQDMDFPIIDSLILLDREVDMITPMCTQLTYEGLVDEFFGVNNGSVEMDASVMGFQQQDAKKVKVPLNSNDKLFREIRDLNFEYAVQVLRQKVTSMKQDYTEMTTANQSVSELKDFVKKLNSLPEITRHINLAQHVSTFTSKAPFLSRLDMEQTVLEAESYDICFEHIEEMIHKQEPLLSVLRFLILFSVTNSGIPRKGFDYLRRELLHSYGFEHVVTLNNLEKARLLCEKKDSRTITPWVTLKRSLHLIVEGTDTASPKDISYVFSGYAPLSVRLVEHALRSGWRPVEELLKLLPGTHTEITRGGGSHQQAGNFSKRSLVLVVFVGGVTFAEISALRFLSTRDGAAAAASYEIIVGTTSILNGNSLTTSLLNNTTSPRLPS